MYEIKVYLMTQFTFSYLEHFLIFYKSTDKKTEDLLLPIRIVTLSFFLMSSDLVIETDVC